MAWRNSLLPCSSTPQAPTAPIVFTWLTALRENRFLLHHALILGLPALQVPPTAPDASVMHTQTVSMKWLHLLASCLAVTDSDLLLLLLAVTGCTFRGVFQALVIWEKGPLAAFSFMLLTQQHYHRQADLFHSNRPPCHCTDSTPYCVHSLLWLHFFGWQ